MPRQLNFLCPFHHEEESISLSDSYFDSFSGEVPCGAKGRKAVLHIKVTAAGQIEELSLVRDPVSDYR